MKNGIIQTVAIIFLILQPAHAQTPQTGGCLTGGWAIPTSDDDPVKTGFTIDAALYHTVHGHVSLGGKIGLSKWPLKDRKIYTSTIHVDGSTSFLEISPVVRMDGLLNPACKVFFEGTFGFFAGFYQAKIEHWGYSSDENRDPEGTAGFSIASGLDLGIFQIKPKLTKVFSKSECTTWFSISLGFVFSKKQAENIYY